jgi:hypothetical protein
VATLGIGLRQRRHIFLCLKRIQNNWNAETTRKLFSDREDGTSGKPEKPELAALIATQKFLGGTLHIASICEEGEYHRLNMELQRFPTFIWAPCVQLYSLAEIPQLPNSPPELDSYTRALLVSQDRRHLCVTPWINSSQRPKKILCILREICDYLISCTAVLLHLKRPKHENFGSEFRIASKPIWVGI